MNDGAQKGFSYLSGDGNDIVLKAQLTITTTPNATSVTLGAGLPPVLTDTATLSNSYYETGSVTFYLFAPGVTPAADYANAAYHENDAVSGGGASTATGYTLPTTGTVTGTYQWEAVYGGDANNNSASENNNVNEQTAVYPVSPTITTSANPSSVTLGAPSQTVEGEDCHNSTDDDFEANRSCQRHQQSQRTGDRQRKPDQQLLHDVFAVRLHDYRSAPCRIPRWKRYGRELGRDGRKGIYQVDRREHQ